MNQNQNSQPKSQLSGAIESAGAGAPQLCIDATIDSVHVREALVDTGSAFSMLSFSLCEKLSSKFPVLSFENAAPDIVGVGGASAEVKGYVEVPL